MAPSSGRRRLTRRGLGHALSKAAGAHWPEMMKPDEVEENWRRRCHGSEKLGSVCVQYTCA